MSFADDVDRLRAQGVSDQTIIDGYKRYNLSNAQDIERLLANGKTPSDIVDGIKYYHARFGDPNVTSGANANTNSGQGPWTEFQKPAAGGDTKPWEEFKKPEPTLMGSLQRGIADTLGGESETLKSLGADTPANALGLAGKVVQPQGGVSATDIAFDSKRPLLDRLKAVPYALVEGAPGLAQDLVAGEGGAQIGGAVGALGGPLAEFTVPAGAAIGGALGFGGSYLARTFGKTAQEVAQARTGDANAVPSEADKVKALGLGVTEAALSRVGAKGALGAATKGAGSEALAQIPSQVAKGAVIDAAAGAGTNLVHQAVVDPNNISPDQVATSAVLGGATGAALRGVRGVGDAANAIKFADMPEEAGSRLASRLADLDTSDPSKSFQAVSKAERDIGNAVDERSKLAQPLIKSLQESSGFTDDTPEVLGRVKSDLVAGDHASPEDLSTLRDRLGDYHEGSNLVDALEEHSALNQLKSAGNFDPKRETFGGGLTAIPAVQDWLNPLGKYAKIGDVGGGLAAATGLHILPGHGALDPMTMGKVVAAQTAMYGGARAVDALTGARNPAGEFVARFRPEQAPATAQEPLPAFRQEQADAQAKAAAEKQAQAQTDTILKATKAKARLMENSQRMEARQATQTQKQTQAQTDAALKAARQKAQLMERSQKAETRQATDAEKAQSRQEADAIRGFRVRQRIKQKTERANEPKAGPQAAQESAVFPGMSNGDVAQARRLIQGIQKRERMHQSAVDSQLKNAANTSRLMKASESKGQAKSGPKASEAPESKAGTMRITAGGDTVERSLEGIKNAARYKVAVQAKMTDRGLAIDAAKKVVPEKYHGDLEELRKRLNRAEGTDHEGAYSVIEDAVNELPEKHRLAAFNALDRPSLWATFKK